MQMRAKRRLPGGEKLAKSVATHRLSFQGKSRRDGWLFRDGGSTGSNNSL
jgi:hypothetical protein